MFFSILPLVSNNALYTENLSVLTMIKLKKNLKRN